MTQVDADVVLSLQRANTPGRCALCGPVQQFEYNCARRSGEYAVRAVSLGVSHHEPPTFYRHPSHADGEACGDSGLLPSQTLTLQVRRVATATLFQAYP